MEQTDPRYGELQGLMAKIEALPEDARNTPEEKALQDQASEIHKSLWGYDPDLWDRANPAMEFDPHIRQALDDLAAPPESEAAQRSRMWMMGIGAALIVAGALTLKFGGAGALLAKAGLKMVGTAKAAGAVGGAAKAASTVTISAKTVTGITSTAKLSSIAKAAGATTAEISKATTAAQLQTLISAKIGTSTLTIASNTVGTATAQTLATTAAANSGGLFKTIGTGAMKAAGKGVKSLPILGGTALMGAQIYGRHLNQSGRYANLSPEQKIEKFESYLSEQAGLFAAQGFIPSDIEKAMQDAREASIPLFNQGG
jgi:hypothetical protein